MNVLVLGANGYLGPHVVKALEREHTLRLTDINDLDTPHEYFKLDVSDLDAVVAAAEGMDAIVNLSVLRHDRQLAFDVSARGAYNMMVAAVEHGIRHVINTGPHFTVAGPSYERVDYEIGPDVTPQPGTNLYALTKSLGQEACKVFSDNHDIYVLTLLFYNFIEPEDSSRYGKDITPYAVTWDDAGEAFPLALTVDESSLPSRCEVFYVFTDMPHGRFDNEKTKRVLGWQPTNRLEQFYTRQPG